MSQRIMGVLVAGLCLGAACSTSPNPAPGSSSQGSTTTTNAASPDGGALPGVTPRHEPGATSEPHPEPLEVLHDAIPELAESSPELKSRRLKVLVNDRDMMAGLGSPGPFVAEDGSLAIYFRHTSSAETQMIRDTMQIWDLDHPEKNRTMVVLDGRVCSGGANGPPCEHPRALASVKPVNAFLSKHRWAELRWYNIRVPSDFQDCGGARNLARHFRAAGYEFLYREPRLLVTREKDGAVVVDRADVTRANEPGECGKKIRSKVGSIGIDIRRRALCVLVATCQIDGCPEPEQEYQFYRLPRPSDERRLPSRHRRDARRGASFEVRRALLGAAVKTSGPFTLERE